MINTIYPREGGKPEEHIVWTILRHVVVVVVVIFIAIIPVQ